MAEVTAALCDIVIVTENEPGREDPREIVADFEVGLRAGRKHPGRDYEVVPDRREAIRHALSLAQPGDVVILPGLGHQQYRRVAGGLEAWDDRAVVRELAGSQRASGPSTGAVAPSAEGRRRRSS
jgi:UDP-N-acetylmuramyl tripeptide synthase